MGVGMCKSELYFCKILMEINSFSDFHPYCHFNRPRYYHINSPKFHHILSWNFWLYPNFYMPGAKPDSFNKQ